MIGDKKGELIVGLKGLTEVDGERKFANREGNNERIGVSSFIYDPVI